jgi:hypothetical protein
MNASTTNGEKIASSGTSRRDFLTLCAGAAVICAVPLAGGIASRRRGPAPGASKAVPPFAAIPRLSDFEPHLGSLFVAAATESQSMIGFTLAKAEALEKTGGFAGEQFSLRFDAPPGHRIESRIYQLRHPVLGSLELFISPVGSADRFGEQQKGEAVVSSLVRHS